jgi:carboxyl-terminal processing protease
LALAMGLGGCATIPVEPPRPPVYAGAAARAEAQLKLLDEVWSQVNRRFYAADFNGADWAAARSRYREQVVAAPDTTALYEVLNEMLAELGDAHTAALTPLETWEEYWAERAFVGLNLEWIDPEVRPGSAAEAAGVRAGWLVLSRNGEPLPDEYFNLPTLEGLTYRWTFLDDRERRVSLELTANRLPDTMPPEEQTTEEGWVYLRFDEFAPFYRDWLRDRLKAHAAAPGIVLDLRRNGGGDVATLERVLRDLMPERVSYGTFVTRGGRRDSEKSMWLGGARYAGPLAVLVGPGSASSAEILAYALQHYGRAVLIGEQTAGVVIASQFFGLSDGGELQLGTFDFRTLDDGRLEGNGVKPDLAIERTYAAARAGRDEALEAAVTWLRGGGAPGVRD